MKEPKEKNKRMKKHASAVKILFEYKIKASFKSLLTKKESNIYR